MRENVLVETAKHIVAAVRAMSSDGATANRCTVGWTTRRFKGRAHGRIVIRVYRQEADRQKLLVKKAEALKAAY